MRKKISAINTEATLDYTVWIPFAERPIAYDAATYCELRLSDGSILLPNLIYKKETLDLEISLDLCEHFKLAAGDEVYFQAEVEASELESIKLELMETERRKRDFISKLHFKHENLLPLIYGQRVTKNSYFQLECMETVYRFKCINSQIDGKQVCGQIGFKTIVNMILLDLKDLYTRPKKADLASFTHQARIYEQATEYLLDKLEIFLNFPVEKSQSLGLLVYGPGGGGKTFLVTETLTMTRMPFGYVNCAKFISGTANGAENRLASFFESEYHVLVLDNIDSILDTGGLFMTSMLLRLICRNSPKFVIGITSRSYTMLDSNLLSTDAFPLRMFVGLPDHSDRIKLLRFFVKDAVSLSLEAMEELAHHCNGFTPLDIMGMVRKGILFSGHNDLSESNLLIAAKSSHPSLLSGMLSKIPNISFAQLYGMEEEIEYLNQHVLFPFKYKEEYEEKGFPPPKGLLISGNSGKTSLAIATANATGLSCIYVDSPSIRSKIVGESERTIAKLFAQARNAAPCILLIDQFEMLVPNRSTDSTTLGSSQRIVTSFLTEMDGIFQKNSKQRIFIIAVSSHRESIDPAILRPGRIDIHLHLNIPNLKSRLAILKNSIEHVPHNLTDLGVERIAHSTEGLSNADLISSIQKASMSAIRAGSDRLTIDHFGKFE